MTLHPYENQYAHDNVYGHAVELLERIDLPRGGIHLDFGCGFGSIAETIRDRLGLRYIGLDILEVGLDSLKARGFEVLFFDLFDPDAGSDLLNKWLPEGVQVVSMSFLDTLEHLAEPNKALSLLHRVAKEHGCPLVLSAPNVAHRDIGFKLLAGQFEYTESGLLDHTHFQYFTDESLTERLAEKGLHEVYRNDVLLELSDQNFPPDQPLLSADTPINSFLRNIRQQIDDSGTVNQFVRLYLPASPRRQREGPTSGPFLTVVTRTLGDRIESLRETLLCLSAQSCQDFEVLVVGHKLTLERQLNVERVISDLHESIRVRTHLVKVDKGERAAPLNAAFSRASGRYVAMLDDDDLVFGHWVETFKELHEKNPGKIQRSTAVSQVWDRVGSDAQSLATRCMGGYGSEYPETFDLLDHLVQNRSPLHSLAFPRSVFSDLGFRFDDSLTTAEDWDFIVRVAPITGVACSTDVTCVYRRWANGVHSATLHDEYEWKSNYQHTLRKIDATPLILPAGYTRKLREMLGHQALALASSSDASRGPDADARSVAQGEYQEALRWRLHQLLHSRSWRYTALIRRISDKFRGTSGLPDMMVWRFNTHDLEHLIHMIENSRSWKLTSFLRASSFGRR